MAKKLSIPLITLDTPEGNAILKNITQARNKRNLEVQLSVEKILDDIRKNGDKALFGFAKKFDKTVLSSDNIQIDQLTIEEQASKVSEDFKTAVHKAIQRIRTYHKKQKVNNSFSLKTSEGFLKQIIRPIRRVGVYVPGGYTTYPSSVLMSVIPATIAGVKEIALVSPIKDILDPSMAYVLNILKIREIYRVGGAQAIGALAYGTQSIPAVDKIVGPGNMYVALAKKYVFGTVDIDSVSGPSEVVILADKTINPSWVALDLLSQAEHGSGDETAICITENRNYAEKVRSHLENEIENSPVKNVFLHLPPHGITIFVSKNRDESIRFINSLAPEHLQIMTKTYLHDVKKIRNAAAIFLGSFTPVVMGDYYVGTNHILPTAAAARYASPLGVDSFLKRISIAEVNSAGLQKSAAHVALFARSENFIHHALSIERRVKKDTF